MRESKVDRMVSSMDQNKIVAKFNNIAAAELQKIRILMKAIFQKRFELYGTTETEDNDFIN